MNKIFCLLLFVLLKITPCIYGFWAQESIDQYWCNQGHFNFDQAKLFYHLANKLNPQYVLETGFCTGRSAASILLSCKPKKFISIDINLDYIKPNGRIYAKKLIDTFSCFQIIENGSSQVLTDDFFNQNFPDGIDWATIDGDHSYTGCYFDLKAISKRLNNNGIIIIDDYKSGPPNGVCLPEVTSAVDDFLVKNQNFIKTAWNKEGKGFAILYKSNQLNQILQQTLEQS